MTEIENMTLDEIRDYARNKKNSELLQSINEDAKNGRLYNIRMIRVTESAIVYEVIVDIDEVEKK